MLIIKIIAKNINVHISLHILDNKYEKDKFIVVEFMHQIVCEFTILIDISKLPYE